MAKVSFGICPDEATAYFSSNWGMERRAEMDKLVQAVVSLTKEVEAQSIKIAELEVELSDVKRHRGLR